MTKSTPRKSSADGHSWTTISRSKARESTDDESIVQAQHGSRSAVNELIRSLQGYLLLIANQELDSGLRAKVGASDLVQSALVLAAQNLNQLPGSSRETLLSRRPGSDLSEVLGKISRAMISIRGRVER